VPDINPMVHHWIRQMEDPDQASAFFAWQCLEREVLDSSKPGNREACEALAGELAEALVAVQEDPKGKSAPPRPLLSSRTRNQLARLLGYTPTDAAVPPLAKALRDLDVREMGRYALESNPSPAATKALIEALDLSGSVFRAGVVNSLAKRKTPEVLAALAKAAADPQREVRIAALEALADHPDPSHDAVIEKATHAECSEERLRAHVARARLAETLRASGNRAAARRIYEAILAGEAPEPQKKAARLALA